MTSNTSKKIAIAGMLIAVGVIGGAWSIPIGASRCAPVQHAVNILAATTLNPLYGVIMAFITSCIRVAMGTGTLLAFPGSMCGAFLSGVMCMAFRKMNFPKKENILGNGALGAAVGELFGTAVIGGMAAYPVAAFIMGKEAAVFTYVFPFFVSTLGGTIIGTIIYIALRKSKALDKMGV